MRVVIRANALGVANAWREKKANLRMIGALGALDIVSQVNDNLLPSYFPGRVRDSVHAVIGPGTNGASLGHVQGVVDKPLFWWYTKGTATYIGGGTYPIDPIHAPALAFYWEKVGERVVFMHVENPGTRPHQAELIAFLGELHTTAYTAWSERLRAFLVG